jgi:hypothetical protein
MLISIADNSHEKHNAGCLWYNETVNGDYDRVEYRACKHHTYHCDCIERQAMGMQINSSINEFCIILYTKAKQKTRSTAKRHSDWLERQESDVIP